MKKLILSAASQLSIINAKCKRVVSSFLIFNLSLIIGGSAQPPNLPGAGNCLRFDGVNDYVQLTSTSALNPTSAVTVEAWIQLSSIGSTTIIFENESGSPYYGYEFLISSGGNIFFQLYASGSYTDLYGSTTLSTGVWYHVVGVYDGSSMKVYLNGQLDGSVSKSGSIDYSVTVNPTIGSRFHGGANFFSGSIDEVRIWNTARTQTQIRDNMCQKLIGSKTGLVGYWRFDETSGTTANDSQINVPPNNGTLK